MVVHTFSPSTQNAEAGRSLSLRLAQFTEPSSRTARATQRNPVSKDQKPQNKNKQKQTKTKKKPAVYVEYYYSFW